MKKISLFFVIVLLCSAPVVAATFTSDTLDDIEKYLNELNTFQANLTQRTQSGEQAMGELYIDRRGEGTGKLKLDYTDVPILLVTKGESLIYFDKELEQTSYIDLEDIPAGLLVQPDIDLQEDVVLRGIQVTSDFIDLKLTDSNDSEFGELTLRFTQNPLKLVGWQVVDVQGVTTDVMLSNILENQEIAQNTFEFYDPKFFQFRNREN